MAIQIKYGRLGQGMTFANRRRLLNYMWAFVSNSWLPFILGFVFCLITLTHSFIGTITAFDKSVFGICIQPDLKEQGGNQ